MDSSRNWQDFEKNWNTSNRYKKLIIASVILHFLAAYLLTMPLRQAEETKIALEEKQKELEQKLEEKLDEEIAKAEEILEEEDIEILAEEQLKEFFEELTEDHLKEEEKEEKWEDIKEKLEESLKDLNEVLAQENLDLLKAEEKVNDLKSEMIDELYADLFKESREEFKENYIDMLKSMVKPLADEFKKNLDQRVGKQLTNHSKAEMNKEVQKARQDLAKAKTDINKIIGNANKIKKSLDANNKIIKDQENIIQQEKKKQEQLNTELKKSEEEKDANKSKAIQQKIAQSKTITAHSESRMNWPKKVIENNQKKLAELNKSFDSAQNKLKELSTPINSELKKVQDTELISAQKENKAENSALKEKDISKALKSAEASSKSLATLIKKSNEIKGKVNQLNPDEIIKDRLKSSLSKLNKDKLKDQLKKAFEEQFVKDALPPLTEQVLNDFKEKAESGDFAPPVLSIEKDVKEILGTLLVEAIDGGNTATKDLEEKNKLKEVKQEEQDGDIEKNFKKEFAKSTEKVIKEQLPQAIKTALNRAKSSLKRGKTKETDEEIAKNELLDKLSNMKNQIKNGRKGMLGSFGEAAIMIGHKRKSSRTLSKAKIKNSKLYKTGYDKFRSKELMELMSGRKNATGNNFKLKGAEGKAAVAKKTESIKPKFLLDSHFKVKSAKKNNKTRKIQSPSFKHIMFNAIPYAGKSITIDGDLKEWDNLNSKPFICKPEKPKGKDAKCEIYAAYDSKGIYIAAKVWDHTGKIENATKQFWLNDCVEVFIDTMNTKFHNRGDTTTHQFYCFPYGKADNKNFGGGEAVFRKVNKYFNTNDKFHSRESFPRMAKKWKHGWILEFLIPRSAINGKDIRPGKILGFNLNVCVGDNVYYPWCYDPKLRMSENPVSWGDVQLLGSDGEIKIINPETKKEANYLVAGKTIKIEVTDRDMNLSDLKKDKVRVKLISNTGDSEDMILQETKNDSGVFSGTINSRLSLGQKTFNVLDVFEGGNVKVIYTDQAQAFGERNVRINKTYKVASSGAILVSK